MQAAKATARFKTKQKSQAGEHENGNRMVLRIIFKKLKKLLGGYDY